jgi:hypothetical protein
MEKGSEPLVAETMMSVSWNRPGIYKGRFIGLKRTTRAPLVTTLQHMKWTTVTAGVGMMMSIIVLMKITSRCTRISGQQ